MKKTTRFYRLTARLLTIAMFMFVTFIPSYAFDENDSDYEKMLEYLKPENGYGLPGMADGSSILHAWNWSYDNIAQNLETIAKQGFGTILVSPPYELKMPTKGVKFVEPAVNGVEPNGWWMFYEPVGFQINESTDNALGTKNDFTQMCDEAHRLGIKIMVESVVGCIEHNICCVDVCS